MNDLTYLHRYEPGTNSEAAPLLLLHGTGGDENDLIPYAREIAPGASLLSPRGDVLEHGMPRFFRRYAEGVFDLDDVSRRAQALANFIAAAAATYGFDLSRLTAIGYSNGANIAASLLLLRPDSLARAVLLRPMVVLQPALVTGLTGKAISIISGREDPIVPPDHPGRLADLFRRGGAQVELSWLETGHQLTAIDFERVRKFISSSI